jgi:phosphomannomutase
MTATNAAFLSYTPVALAFGTSGLRGLVTDITDLEAYINVKGALRYLVSIGDIEAGGVVVLGGDLRPSTDRIMGAAARAIVDAGFAVENAGKIPTPAVILHSLATHRAGVMVSGSHIPFDRNGIKINRSKGEVLKSDEAGITREVDAVRAEEYGRSAGASAFTALGMLKEPMALPAVDRAAEERYVARYVEGFGGSGRRALEGLSVLVYEHSAVGRDLLGRVLRELGAKVLPAGRAATFIPIDTENVTDELLGRLVAMLSAAEASGEAPDAIVSTDGDSDRPFVAAVLPRGDARRVQFLPGDLLGIVVAELLGADAVAVPISSNDAVERRMTELGVWLDKTKIGSPYVVAAIEELSRRAGGGHKRVVGWEANGGFLLGSQTLLVPGATALAPLPTRDSMLPILANLFAARSRNVSLSALWSQLPRRYGRSGLKDQVPVAVSRAILAGLVPPGDVTEVELGRGDDGAVRRRDASGESSSLDPAMAAPWLAASRALARCFSPERGFADIVRINVLDGVRVYFANGDVAHVRPSGNAPQLRLYANSDTQERADQIVDLGLQEPGGILAELQATFA